MMYSTFDKWREEMDLISWHLPKTPEEALKKLLDEEMSYLRNELNMSRIAAVQQEQFNKIMMNYAPRNEWLNDFGRDEKGRIINSAAQLKKVIKDSYSLNFFEYHYNLFLYKRAEKEIANYIKKAINSHKDFILLSYTWWGFKKFPELIERLEFLGYKINDKTNYLINLTPYYEISWRA